MTIEKHILELLTVEGFILCYYEHVPYYGTLKQAYEATERQYEHAFGRNKYSDYDTFRVTLTRYNQKKLTMLTKNQSK